MSVDIIDMEHGVVLSVLNLEEAERSRPMREGVVCISVTSPTIEADLQDGWKDVLRLTFSDLDKTLYPSDARLARQDTLFTEEQAHEIIDFALTHRNSPIVVHCEAGVSRSPAIALALYEIFVGKAPPMAYERRLTLHNRYVRTTLLNAWRERERVDNDT